VLTHTTTKALVLQALHFMRRSCVFLLLVGSVRSALAVSLLLSLKLGLLLLLRLELLILPVSCIISLLPALSRTCQTP
jgi:hypothetical protein